MPDTDALVAEFSDSVRDLFAPHRRDIELLKSRVHERARNHQSTNELHRLLVLEVCGALQRESTAA